MDIIHDLPGFQVFDVFEPGNTPTPTEPPPRAAILNFLPRTKRLKIRAYSDFSICSTVPIAGTPTRIVGRLDSGFCIGYLMPSNRATDSQHFIDTYLVVLNTKHTRSRFGRGRGMDDEVNQMSAYLAMIHNARANWLSEVNRVGGGYTAYGLVSDDLRFRFIFLNKRLTIVIPFFLFSSVLTDISDP